MQTEEHQLRIGGAGFVGVDLLQAFHGLNAKRCGCIVKPHQVGGEIHHHMTHRRMVFGHFREDPGKEWPDDAGKKTDASCFLSNTHKTHEQGHDPDQSDTKRDCIFCGFKNAIGG